MITYSLVALVLLSGAPQEYVLDSGLSEQDCNERPVTPEEVAAAVGHAVPEALLLCEPEAENLAIAQFWLPGAAEPIRWAVPVANCGAPMVTRAEASGLVGAPVERVVIERCTLDMER